MKTRTRSARRPRLTLDALERRDTPAGSVTAVFSHGVLTLLGDAEANLVQISAVPDGSGADVVVTGLDGTLIDGQTEFENVRAIRANLKGGDDTLAADPSASFVLDGGLSVDLGDGSNTLDLSPADSLGLGSLAVRAKSGMDEVHLTGPDGHPSWIAGNVDLSLGEGGSATALSGLEILGRLNLAAGEGDDSVSINGTRVGRPSGPSGSLSGSMNLSGGKGTLTVETDDSAFPATTTYARGPILWNSGGDRFVSLAMTSADSAEVSFADSYAVRAVSVTGGPMSLAKFSMTGSEQATAGPVTVRGGDAEVMIVDAPAARIGKLDITGKDVARFETDGSAVEVGGPASVRATAGTAAVSASGSTVSFLSRLTVGGRDSVDVSFQTTGPSGVAGDLVITGGKADDSVWSNENFQIGGDLRVSLGAGANAIHLGGESGGMTIGGRMMLTTGAGEDEISLTQMDVGGPVSIGTAGGSDQLSIQGPSVFHRAVEIDLGAGDDALALGTETPGLTFDGIVSIHQGAGDDTMTVDPSGGDTGMVLKVAGSQIDGGAGTDTLTESLIQPGLRTNVQFVNYEVRG